MNEFKTMKEIGAFYGLTSHQVGKILKGKGLRTDEGKPSRQAFDLGMVEKKHDELGHYLYAWHVGKTKAMLVQLGYKEKLGDSAE